ncbi:MFS transporter [Paenibacillus sp. MMS18-CY102]|nr:MFS transporter [Paenibacillus sp. MMS18-CY102]
MMTRLVILGCIAFLVVGLGQLVVGTVMEPMVHAYGVQYGDGGQLVMNQFLGGVAGVLLAPWLMKLLGKKKLLLTALACMVLAEGIYAFQPPWLMMLITGPIAGFGFGTTEAVVASFIILTAGNNANVAMSRVEVSFGVGALLMPFAGAPLISSGNWMTGFAVVSVLAIVTLVLWLLFWPRELDQSKEEAKEAEIKSAQAQASISRSRRNIIMIACGLFIAVYVGFEISLVHYFPSLLVKNGLSDASASLSLSVYWGAMVLGRLVSGHIADRWGGAPYMLVTCSACAVLFLILGITESTGGMFALAFGMGLVMSGMYSIAIVFSSRALPGSNEKTISFLMMFGGVGGAFMPKLTGWFIDRNGVADMRWLFVGFAIAMLAVIAWAIIASRKTRKLAEATAA